MNLILTLLIISVPSTESEVEPYPSSTCFESFSTPQPVRVEGNPLDFCGARIGLDVRDIELPRGHEGGYRYAARFPIIDYVSNRPLYMKQWAEDNARELIARNEVSGISALIFAQDILRGTGEYPEVSDINAMFATQKVKTEISRFIDALEDSDFTQGYKTVLIELFLAYSTASYYIQHASGNLTDAEIEFLLANPGYFIAPDGQRMLSLTGDVSTQFDFIEKARKVDYKYIWMANYILSEAVEKYLYVTSRFYTEDFYQDLSRKAESFLYETPYGTFVVSGVEADTVTGDAAIIIDLGGDDLYRGKQASGIMGISIVIDSKGNDTYEAGDMNYTQGFGFLGLGFLIDLEGNDTYSAKHFSQGAGIMGIGTILDMDGDDRYDAHAFCQGAGMFGLGMIADTDGDDFYDCATLGQGAATTLGLGVLSDLSGTDTFLLAVTKGKDNLKQSPGYGQGGALSFRHYPWNDKLTAYGGVGMLVDAGGNDRYHTKGWCDQGGSYIMSLGVLFDRGGNDHYTAGTGQGSGIHVTNAILVDKSGDDKYEGGFRTGGSGGDRSPGFLLDYGGNDTYKAGRACYGTGVKPFSFSLMIDYLGEDTYIANDPAGKITFNNWESFGGVWPESEPNLWPWGIFMDLDGADDYQVRFRADNTEYCSFGHGIALDVERDSLNWHGNDVIGEVERPLQEYVDFELPRKVQKSEYYDDIKLLQTPDLFVRFQAIGRIVSNGPEVIPDLVEVLLNSEHIQYNRDLLECIHYFLVNGQVTDEYTRTLIRLLQAPDPEVRTLIADDLGVWTMSEAENALVKALDDSVPSVRRFALRSLTALESKKGLKKAEELVIDDSSEDVRRTALYYLIQVSKESIYSLLEDRVKNVEASSVRIAAIDGIRHLGLEEGLDLIYQAAEDPDVYVQRAAGKALAELYEVAGIQVLIQSLDFPSIDAFDNYNRNVPNYIAAYAGHDLGDNRYKQDAWQEWFDENEDSIDIHYNVDSYREYTRLSRELGKMDDTGKIDALEVFLQKYPGHAQACNTLASTLNRIAWFLVTDAKGTEEFDPARAIEYADRAVELDPQANYVDTQAEAYLASGDLDRAEEICSNALERWPGNSMFTERLELIGELRK